MFSCRSVITENGKLTSSFAYISDMRERTRKRRVLVLGAGLVAGPAVDYLVESGFDVTVAAENQDVISSFLGRSRHADSVATSVANISPDDVGGLQSLVGRHDAVLSLVPAFLHPVVARACIATKKNMVRWWSWSCTTMVVPQCSRV